MVGQQAGLLLSVQDFAPAHKMSGAALDCVTLQLEHGLMTDEG